MATETKVRIIVFMGRSIHTLEEVVYTRISDSKSFNPPRVHITAAFQRAMSKAIVECNKFSDGTINIIPEEKWGEGILIPGGTV